MNSDRHRTRHHSIARRRFYAFFFEGHRLDTLQNRFSSLTFTARCRRLQSFPHRRDFPSGHTHAQTCPFRPSRVVFSAQSAQLSRPGRRLASDRVQRTWFSGGRLRHPFVSAIDRHATRRSVGERGPSSQPLSPPPRLIFSCSPTSPRFQKRPGRRSSNFLIAEAIFWCFGGMPFTRAAYRDPRDGIFATTASASFAR